jgi:hypothetical protein
MVASSIGLVLYQIARVYGVCLDRLTLPVAPLSKQREVRNIPPLCRRVPILLSSGRISDEYDNRMGVSGLGLTANTSLFSCPFFRQAVGPQSSLPLAPLPDILHGSLCSVERDEDLFVLQKLSESESSSGVRGGFPWHTWHGNLRFSVQIKTYHIRSFPR